MYEYFMEYCKPYRQLMPVEYQKQDDGQYHKVRMACHNADSCDINLKECRHFQVAPETLPKERLREKKIGE